MQKLVLTFEFVHEILDGVNLIRVISCIKHPPAQGGLLRGRSHDTGMTFIPERVRSIPIYFSVSVYMIPRRNFVPEQVIPE